MKDFKVGDKVQIHPFSTFVITQIYGKMAKLKDVKTGEIYALTPFWMLELVED